MSKDIILDKDKLWVVAYISICSIDNADVPIYINEFANSFKYDKSVNTIIIPTREPESKIEFYNAEKLTPEVLEHIKKNIEKLEN